VTGSGDRAELRRDLRIDRGVWIAVRAYGPGTEPRNLRVAHSAPIFVTVDESGFVKTEPLPELVARQRKLLAEMATSRVDPMGDLEPWETKELLIEQYDRQRAALASRIEEADRRYAAMLTRESRAQEAAETTVMLSLALAALLVTRGRERKGRDR
jgi:hypothetical protein